MTDEDKLAAEVSAHRSAMIGTTDMAWTRTQCAAYLGVSIAQLATLRTLPRALVGKSPRYDPDTVRAWLRAQQSHHITAD